MVSLQTPNSSIYLNIKGDLKKFGFTYTRTATNDHATLMYYTKNNLELALASSTDESRPTGIRKLSTKFRLPKQNNKNEP